MLSHVRGYSQNSLPSSSASSDFQCFLSFAPSCLLEALIRCLVTLSSQPALERPKMLTIPRKGHWAGAPHCQCPWFRAFVGSFLREVPSKLPSGGTRVRDCGLAIRYLGVPSLGLCLWSSGGSGGVWLPSVTSHFQPHVNLEPVDTLLPGLAVCVFTSVPCSAQPSPFVRFLKSCCCPLCRYPCWGGSVYHHPGGI